MLDIKEFLKEYNISEEDFKKADISCEELEAIYDDYQIRKEHLRNLGKEFVNDYLYDIEKAGIHSYRYRTKASKHLYISVQEMIRFMIRIFLIFVRMVFIVLYITLLSTKDTMLKSNVEHFLKKDGVRLITISYIHTIRMMRC